MKERKKEKERRNEMYLLVFGFFYFSSSKFVSDYNEIVPYLCRCTCWDPKDSLHDYACEFEGNTKN